jgi:hypothetical protein
VADKAEHTSADARPRPSLTRSSGQRPSGFLPLTAWWLVRSLEPIGYVAAAAIGLGLWIQLDDYLTGLSDVVTLALLVASAAALWWAAWVVGNYPFAETWRVGNAVYAAAIGTTGWIAWLAAERLGSDARFMLTAGIVAVCSYVVQRFRGDLVTWILLIVSMFATATNAGATLAGSVEERAAGFAVIGALAAAVGAYLIAGRAPKARYEATTLIVLAITIPTLLTGFGLTPALAIGAAVAGLGAALAAYFATRPATLTGKISAAVDAVLALAVLVAVARIDVPLPIVLIVAGSVVLAVLGWAAKSVFGSSPDIPAAETPPEFAADSTATAHHDRSDVDTMSPPTVAVAAPQMTNGLAIASLILGITWIFWIGSLLAVILGHVALSQTDDSGGRQGGRGMAIAGLVLGYIALGVFALIVVVLVVDPGTLP